MRNREAQVYVLSAEVAAQPGCEMWGQAEGAFVYCYVNAFDARDAASRVAAALEEDKYGILAFEWIMVAGEMDWEDDDAPEHRASAEEAARTGGVVYSTFDAWERE